VGRGRTAGLSSPAGFPVGGCFLASAVIQVETADWESGSLGLVKFETEIFFHLPRLLPQVRPDFRLPGGGGGKVIETAVYKIKTSILQVQNSLLGLLEKKN
jgi:hypothetical protein